MEKTVGSDWDGGRLGDNGESPHPVSARHQRARRATCVGTSPVFRLKRITGYAEAILVDVKRGSRQLAPPDPANSAFYR
jgi:hypothetical protein